MMFDQEVESAEAIIETSRGKSIEQFIIQFSLNCTPDPLEQRCMKSAIGGLYFCFWIPQMLSWMVTYPISHKAKTWQPWWYPRPRSFYEASYGKRSQKINDHRHARIFAIYYALCLHSSPWILLTILIWSYMNWSDIYLKCLPLSFIRFHLWFPCYQIKDI